MASYTDDPKITFRPYVKQLSTEAEVAVGTYKQKQYDEGYQRIQSQIDKVAGLSIMRDVDKQYFQSKMNQLGANLRMVSMGDLSNYQLVNSIGGMVNNVGKDKYIQAAVTSTARVQKELDTMEKLRKEGKSDRNNEEYFNEKILSPYLSAGLKDSSGKPISFSGSFSPYVDITDEIRKKIKDAGMDERILENMYQTDANGKLRRNADGSLMAARTMTQVKESSNARAVEAIIHNVLSRGDVQGQLNIDAWANTRRIDSESMLESYSKKITESISGLDNDVIELNALLAGKATEDQKKEIKIRLEAIDEQKKSYKRQLEQLSSLETTDPQRFKEFIYKNNYENDLRYAFTKTTREERNLDNPLIKQMNKEYEMKFQADKEMFDQKIKLANLAIAKENLKVSQREIDLKERQYFDQNKPDGETVPSQIPGTENMSATMRNQEMLSSLNATNYQKGVDLLYDIRNRATSLPSISKKTFIEDMEESARKAGVGVDDYVAMRIRAVGTSATKYNIQLSTRDKLLAKEYLDGRASYIRRSKAYENVTEMMKQKYGINPDEYLEGAIPASVTVGEVTKSYTKQDMLNYALYDKSEVAKKDIDTKYGNKKGFENHVKDILTRKYGEGKPSYVIVDAEGMLPPMQVSTGVTDLYKTSNEWKSLQQLLTKDYSKYKGAFEEREKVLSEIFHTDEREAYAIEGKPEFVKKEKGKALTFITNNEKLSSPSGKGVSTEWFAKALRDEKSLLSYNIIKPFSEDQDYTGTLQVTYEGETREINIESRKQMEALTGKTFSPYIFNEYKALAIGSKHHCTNSVTTTSDPNAWMTAAINDNTFISIDPSNIKQYIPLGADLTLIPSVSGYPEMWVCTVYVKDKVTNDIKPIESDRKYAVGSESLILSDISKLTELDFAKKLNK